MIVRHAIRIVAILALLAGARGIAASRPNLLIIMSDDMGFSDLGCYGGEIATPNLDALAADGARFTQFYNTARCCPTRASLLTGLYPHQAGIGHMVDSRGERSAAYQGDLNRQCRTIAEVLKPAGYRTCIAGKWHVTPKTRPGSDSEKYNWPLQRGFDHFYGTIHGAGSFFDPNSLVCDNTLISPYADPEYQPHDGYYYTDAITAHASRFIREHHEARSDQPFFLYIAYTAAHWPMHARPEDIAKYKGRYDQGYEPVRRARVERLRQLGLIDPAWETAAQAGNWDEVANKAFEARCMEVYAAMIDRMDQDIGKLIATLKATGTYDDTLLFFLQDNGGCAEGMGRGKKDAPAPRAAAPTLPPMAATDLQYDMIPRQTRDGFPVRQGYGVLPGAADTYIGYGEAWANVSNTPFREYKHWVHEGGISTPLIAHWPAGMKGAKGRLITTPTHLIDLMATCADLGAASYPTEVAGEKITPLEGQSLRPLLTGETAGWKPRPLYWEHEGNRAIREGDWKLVAKGPGGPWELYNMTTDRTEQHDLAAQEPDKVKALAAQWTAWAQRAGVLPWPWDKGKGKKAPR